MLRTKSLTVDISEIPREWIFEHYLKLPMKLTGQEIKIKSVFNPLDKNPSFSIYVDRKTNNYRYKDFSADKGGDCLQLVQDLFHITRASATRKVIEDYNQWLLDGNEGSLREFKVRAKYKLKSFEKRNWTTKDKYYWTKFRIGSKLLEKYHVYPLDHYILERSDEQGTDQLNIKGLMIYGFFREDGRLYKIYQPMIKENKYIKLESYIQGSEQLTYKKDYLIVSSGLKDLMGLDVLGITNIESIAPDSENSLLPDSVIASYKHKYKGICTLFDNDDAGKKAKQKWIDRYGIDGVTLEMSKDIADSIRDYDLEKVRQTLVPLLRQVFNKK